MKLGLRKRIFWSLLLMTACLGILTLRLAFLQLFDAAPKAASAHGRNTAEMAVLQREARIELDTGRGRFVDDAGQPLTGEVVFSPVLFPRHEALEQGQLKAIAALLKTSPDKLNHTWLGLQHPAFWCKEGKTPFRLTFREAEKLEEMGVSSIKPLPVALRYPNSAVGRQWLGFLAEQPEYARKINGSQKSGAALSIATRLGAAGLEKTFDRLMRGEGDTVAAYLVDAASRPLSEEALRVEAPSNPYYPLTVATTINLDLQSKLEKLAVQKGVKEGAIVVLDAATRDIKAMVSLPFFNPNQVDPAKDSWSNRAVKEAVPGSVFKIVTAAAALESRVSQPNERFVCTGDYGKYGLSCWKKGGHGPLTLAQAFAESCNTTFAAVGERLTPAALNWTADALGLGRPVGWRRAAFIDGKSINQIDQEEAGTVFGSETHPDDGGVKAQTAIGQRNVRLSPLQAANLIATLLHGGKVQSPRLVSGIYYANGTLMRKFERQDSPGGAGGHISSGTARTLLKWMRNVVTEGTGKKLQQAKWELAGKSGTAQVTRAGKALNDQWFIGYGPVANPKYTVAVLVQSRQPGSAHLATEVFGGVMDALAGS